MRRSSSRRTAAGIVWAAALASTAAGCEGEDVSQVLELDQPALLPGGGEQPANARCVPGRMVACAGDCEQPVGGYQVCADDGRSYGECICPDSERLDAASSDGPPTPPDQGAGGGGRVGAACKRDAECGPGLACFEADAGSLGAGAPAGGYCTRRCIDASDCSALDPAAACGTLAGRDGLCVRLCESGDSASVESKCLDRQDVTCASLVALGDAQPDGAGSLGVCVPQCQSDTSCPKGRCDLRTGLCASTPPSGAPLGSACRASTDCASGTCFTPDEAAEGFCSASCTLGVAGCGFDGSEPIVGAACLIAQVPGEGRGDRGLCYELCDSDEDCSASDAECLPTAGGGRAGICLRGAVPPDVRVGNACEGDDDCGDGLLCLTPDSDPFGIGGGPAGGYCSTPCSESGACPTGSTCAFTPTADHCMRRCDAVAATDCGGRSDLSCVALGGASACVPDCQTDADCGDRVCDPVTGLCFAPPPPPECGADEDCGEGVCDTASGTCVPEPPGCGGDDDCRPGSCDLATGRCIPAGPGSCDVDGDCARGVCEQLAGVCIDAPPIPIGGSCSEDTECSEDTCLELGGSSFCSGICLVNTPLGCESYGSDAFCLLPFDGDFGLCLELCNLAADCEQDGYECVALGGELNGRTGFCLPPEAEP